LLGSRLAGISPLRLGFTGTLKVIPRAIPDFQDIQPEQLPFYTKLIREILAEKEYLCAPTRLVNSYSIDKTWEISQLLWTLGITPALKFIYIIILAAKK